MIETKIVFGILEAIDFELNTSPHKRIKSY